MTRVCNGIDDDCNGAVDEDYVLPVDGLRRRGLRATGTTSCARRCGRRQLRAGSSGRD